MGTFIFIALFLIAVTLFAVKKRKKLPRKPKLHRIDIPEHLGIRDKSLVSIVERLESSLSDEYIKKVQTRVLDHHPDWTEADFDWRLFELKRYFIMNSILQTVPMFSHEVDEIWHEMLLFTKEYENFSNAFLGSYLHHTPNLNVQPIPDERAFFDWVYVQLFETTKNSHLLWGRFFREPLNQTLLTEFKNRTEAEILDKYFSRNEDGNTIGIYIIRKLKQQIEDSKKIRKTGNKKPFNRTASDGDFVELIIPMVFLSLYYSDTYENEMNELIPIDLSQESSSNSGSGFFGDSSDASGSSDSSCSSCSSCGGGCS